ncbi:glycosyltransferase family 2 protein [Thiolapillus brandeum]|uniref:Dolichol-phosphate mannosyltransferase n=1 Tax=Thiolapillus brandeum TaxID=1076588 RepID=A0A7U6GJA0_9GAMM|nr:glycosyltransferase family 2 protein [Thiolapillus brandeum]BAO44733.1 dolichol-phosphate mannosyltransferase [Thiolapillus brandeum]
MELSVVVPVFNEQDNLKPLIDEIHAALKGRLDYEIIYVNDGSTDETLATLETLCRNDKHLRVLSHARSCGQSTAVRTGVKSARSPWIATLDGDGQNDPADIPAMYSLVQQEDRDPDLCMIAGWRRKRQDSALKKFSSRLANGVRARILKDDTPDTGCGLKLFSREAFLELPYFDHMHRFLPALILRSGKKLQSVEVNHRPRHKGESKYGVHNRLWTGIVDMMGVLWLQRRGKRPDIREL